MELPVAGTPTIHRFYCNFARLPLITKDVHYILCFRDSWIREQLPLEFLDYYVTALLWARLLHIKRDNFSKPITDTENLYMRCLRGTIFTLPEPIHKFLMMIGNIRNHQRGWKLLLGDHTLPVTVIDSRGGYHGKRISSHNHVLFEEIPSLGVSADCIMCLASMGNLTEPPFPFLPKGTQASLNMVGYFGPGSPITEPVSEALKSFSITGTTFWEDIDGTRLNLRLINYVFNIIQKSGAFRLSDFSVSNMSVEGSETQLLQSYPAVSPDPNSPEQTWTQRYVHLRVQPNFNTECVKANYYAGFQLFKEEDGGANLNWCCVKPRGCSDVWTVTRHSWVRNRNVRRREITNFWGKSLGIVGKVGSQYDATRDYCWEHVCLPDWSSLWTSWDFNL